jgi:hypothetical protein
MANMPDEIKKKMSIKKIENDGRLVENKKYEKEVKLRDETRVVRLRRKEVTIDEILSEAERTKVDNDKDLEEKSK